jgi:hypothetical protein
MATRPPDAAPTPTRLDWAAAALVVLSAVAFSLIRAQSVNLPWHLATARLAEATGHWPSRNTFSYTFPDHPVYQQYPAFQAAAWTVLRLAGWGGLSVLTAVGWTAAFLLFMRWGGPWRRGALLHPFWMFGLYALQRRMVMRPDMFSMLALGAELLCLDAYARGRRWAIVGVPLAHLFWVNSHQLFPVSLVVQALFAGHVLAQRWPRLRAPGDPPAPPLAPVVAALLASVALCFATPLGAGILNAPGRTAQSLVIFRRHVAEFQRVWTMPLELGLSLMTGLPAAWALWRTRRAPSLFDLGLWLLSLAMLVAAVRGLMFFGVISVGVFQRALARGRAAGLELVPGAGPTARRGLGLVGVALTTILGGNVLYHRWIHAPLVLGGTQPGLGRSIGGWAESATDFLRASPPPGHAMTMSGGLGDLLIFSVPGIPVFVDSRLESYPLPFLDEVLGCARDDARLAGVLERHGVQWMFVEHFRDNIRARAVHLLANGWAPVYVDSDYLVLVRDAAPNAAYLAEHRIDLRHARPADLLVGPLELRTEQRLHFARLMHAIGADDRADEQRRAARAEAGPEAAAIFDSL